MDFGTTVTGAVTGMAGEFSTVGVTAIGIAVGLFGLQRGWKFLRSLV